MQGLFEKFSKLFVRERSMLREVVLRFGQGRERGDGDRPGGTHRPKCCIDRACVSLAFTKIKTHARIVGKCKN